MPTAQWFCSTADTLWQDRSIAVQDPPVLGATPPELTLTAGSPRQAIDGFGGCFNELGWDALSHVDEATRREVMQRLFGDAGCRFNICRMPVGASDYALDYYSLDDTPDNATDDLQLKNFSLDRDRKLLLPYIQAAMQVRPDLKVWGSPWTPPAWMKYSRQYKEHEVQQHGIRWEKPVLQAYAEYLARASLAYRAEGLNFYAIHLQNEVAAAQIFPSCLWSGEHIRDFLRDYLGPCFAKHHLDVELWLGTVNSADYAGYIVPSLSDPGAMSYVRGVGLQWDGKHGVSGLHTDFPAVKVMQTETECGGGDNDWAYAEYTFSLMKLYFEAGVSGYMQWNMVLDTTGMSRWGWKQCAMVSVDTQSHTVRYNPHFYVVQHMSRFVPPGSRLLSVEGHGNALAFATPKGQTVWICVNDTDQPKSLTINDSAGMLGIVLPARSFNTFVRPDSH